MFHKYFCNSRLHTLNLMTLYKIASYSNFFCYLLNKEVRVFSLETDFIFFSPKHFCWIFHIPVMM